jgi:hypothetical protein
LERLTGNAARGRYPGLRLLVLFGSRARGDIVSRSDWDLAYLAESGFDPDRLLGDAVATVDADRVDLVDLGRAGGQIRFRVARDGRPLFETRAGEFDRFWHDAVTFWCDVEPIVRPGYEGVLSRLSR